MVFVSYSWKNENPDIKVLEFVAFLRKNGYDAKCDIMYMQQETAISFPKMMAKCLKDAERVILILTEEYKKKADLFSNGVGDEYQYIISDINTNKNKYILVSFETINANVLKKIVPDFLQGRKLIDLAIDKNNNYEKLFSKLNNEEKYVFPEVNPAKTQIKQIVLEAESYQVYGLPLSNVVSIVRGQNTVLDPELFEDKNKKSLVIFLSHMIELMEYLREMILVDSINQRKYKKYKGNRKKLNNMGYSSLYEGAEKHYTKKHNPKDKNIEIGWPQLYYEITQELLLYEDKLDQIIQEVLGKKANKELERIKKTDMWNQLIVEMLPWPQIKNPEKAISEISETIGTLKASIQLLGEIT